MSRGPGIVQRRIMAAFEDQPAKRFTVEELCELAYPGEAIERKHKESVRRALNKIVPDAGLWKSRAVLPDGFGWRHIVGRQTV